MAINTINSWDTLSELRRYLPSMQNGSSFVTGAVAINTDGINYFVYANRKSSLVETVDAIMHEEKPAQYLWDVSCLLYCQMFLSLRVYLSSKNSSEEQFSLVVEVFAANLKGSKVVFQAEKVARQSEECSPVFLRCSEFNGGASQKTDESLKTNIGNQNAYSLPHLIIRSKGGQAFLKALLPRLNSKNNNGAPTMPFELEVVEAALISKTQRLEQKLMDVEPRVATLLEMLPNRLTADTLEQLRLSKQALVELASRAGALRQMLLELLEDSNAIRRMTVIGRCCVVHKRDGSVECSVPSDKQVVEEEEEEIEMLLDNYLQRCESCHGQAERLLDTAKEMEDSIAVSLSSRRLEVSRLELLLQVGTFCTALGALVAGIFGMNLKSYLEEHVFAFWLTTAGIIFGAIALFVLMHSYLKKRKIL